MHECSRFQYFQASAAKFILQEIWPYVVQFIEIQMSACPSLKIVGDAHEFSHKLIHSIVAITQIQSLVTFRALLDLLPERKSARKHGGGIGCCIRRIRSHISTDTPGQVQGNEQAISYFATGLDSGSLASWRRHLVSRGRESIGSWRSISITSSHSDNFTRVIPSSGKSRQRWGGLQVVSQSSFVIL